METPPCSYARRMDIWPGGACADTPPPARYDRQGVFYVVPPLLTMPPQTEHKSPRHTCLGPLIVIS